MRGVRKGVNLGALLVMAIAPQAPALPTFAEIQRGMLDAFRDYRNYTDRWEFRHGETTMVYSRKLDGGRFYYEVSVNDTPYLIDCWDGNSGITVSHPNKQYRKRPTPPKPSTVPEKPEAKNFEFKFNGPYTLSFTANPEPRVLAVVPVTLDVRPARLVYAVVEGEEGEPLKPLQMWFEKDRWALRKAVFIDGKGDHSATTFIAVTTKVDREAKLDASDFTVDPATLAGYEDTTPGGASCER